MPFDEEEDTDLPSEHAKKVGLKKVSTQKSIFDSMPKKPTQAEFDKKVKSVHDKVSSYKEKAAELAFQFHRAMADKTLKQNKTIFSAEIEQDLLSKMIQLAVEINNDPVEPEGMGSLSWITILLKTCFIQRDKINNLEYALSQIEKKIESTFDKKIEIAVSREIKKGLDGAKKSE